MPAATARAFWLTERARSSPYYPALSHPVFRCVLPGAAASALGDGMSAVAIAWLALKLAPEGSRGLLVGGAARRVLGGVRRGRGDRSARRAVPAALAGVADHDRHRARLGAGAGPARAAHPLWVGLAAFFAGAVIWGPWTSLSMAVFQDACPPGALAQVIAARSSLLILAAPLGTALGGPIVAALGARGTLLASALATIALGLMTVAALARARTVARKPGTSG